MGRPRNVSDERILDEARACFLEQGAGVSTQVIAERLGVSHAVLFQRFGTKEHLMKAALLPRDEPPWIGAARAGPDERPLRDQLVELATAISTFLEAVVPCVAVLRAAGIEPGAGDPPDAVPGPLRARREVTAWFARAAKKELVRDVKPEHAADLFLGALQVRPFFHHVARKPSSRTDAKAYVELVADVVARALGTTPKKRRRTS